MLNINNPISTATKSKLAKLLIKTGESEMQIQFTRQRLCNLPSFEPQAAFQRIDRGGKGYITAKDIQNYTKSNTKGVDTTEISNFIKFFESSEKGKLQYSEFLRVVLPWKKNQLRTHLSRKKTSDTGHLKCLPADVERLMQSWIEKELKFVGELELLRWELAQGQDFNFGQMSNDSERDKLVDLKYLQLLNCIDGSDNEDSNYIDKSKLKQFLKGFRTLRNDDLLVAVMRRIDSQADNKLSVKQFLRYIRPKQKHQKQEKKQLMHKRSSSVLTNEVKYMTQQLRFDNLKNFESQRSMTNLNNSQIRRPQRNTTSQSRQHQKRFSNSFLENQSPLQVRSNVQNMNNLRQNQQMNVITTRMNQELEETKLQDGQLYENDQNTDTIRQRIEERNDQSTPQYESDIETHDQQNLIRRRSNDSYRSQPQNHLDQSLHKMLIQYKVVKEKKIDKSLHDSEITVNLCNDEERSLLDILKEDCYLLTIVKILQICAIQRGQESAPQKVEELDLNRKLFENRGFCQKYNQERDQISLRVTIIEEGQKTKQEEYETDKMTERFEQVVKAQMDLIPERIKETIDSSQMNLWRQIQSAISSQQNLSIRNSQSTNKLRKSITTFIDPNLHNNQRPRVQLQPSRIPAIQPQIEQDSVQPDLIFFYSSPLVEEYTDKTNQVKLKSTSSNELSVDMEYKKLVKILRDTKKEIKIVKSAINWESLKQQIARKPKIIHISCHGDYDNNKKEFYLQFENKGTGIAEKFYSSQLKKLLGPSKDHGIKLAFVSACHSEEMGNIFRECGIPIVIAVNSETAIADDICLLFSRHLYLHLIEGSTVENAFEEAKVAATMINSQSCCCAHEHDKNCAWAKYAQEHGYEKAHQLHSGECNCKLEGGKHYKTCARLIEFKQFMLDQAQSTIKIKKENQPSSNDQKPSYMDLFKLDDVDIEMMEMAMIPKDDKAEVDFICCCKPHLPHNEEMKFCLKGSDNDKKMRIFKNTIKGDLEQLDQNLKNRIPQNNDNLMIFGRNKLIQKCVQMLTDDDNRHKLIYIYGEPGLGKKNLAQAAIQYCVDRNYFEHGAFQVDIEPKSDTNAFFQQILTTMRLNHGKIQDLTDAIRDSSIALLVNQTEELLTKDKREFKKLINELLDQTNIRIVMTMSDKKHLQSFIEQYSESNIQVSHLTKLEAAEILKKYDEKSQNLSTMTIEDIANHELFKVNKLSNKKILSIYRLLNSIECESKLDKIVQVFSRQSTLKSEYPDETVSNDGINDILYQQMSRIYGKEVYILHILCQAPSGLLSNDIKEFLNQNPSLDMKPENCEKFLQSMVQECDHNHSELMEHERCQQSNELLHMTDQKHGFKFLQKTTHEDLHQTQYVINDETRHYINSSILDNNRTGVLLKYFEYMAILGRRFVRSQKLSENQDFDLEISSVEIDEGLWTSFQNKELKNDDDIYQIHKKFTLNETNFLQAFDLNLLKRMFSNGNQNSSLIQLLEEIHLTFVTLLIMQGRHVDALQKIQKAMLICDYYKMKITEAKLKIIEISLRPTGNVQSYQYDLLKELLEKFRNKNEQLLEAEIYFLNAVMKIQDYIDFQNIRYQTQDEDLSINKRRSSSYVKQSMRNIGSMHKRKSFHHMLKGRNKDSIKYLPVNDPQSRQLLDFIESNLDNAEQIYQNKNLKLCQARISLYKSEFYLEYNENKFIQGLDSLERASDAFETNLCIQHQVNCMIYISQILLLQNKLKEAKDKIIIALGLANTLKDPDSQKASTDLLNEIQEWIHIEKSNQLLIFLTSQPLDDLVTFINYDLEQLIGTVMIKSMKKKLNLSSELLTRKQLQFIRDHGCKILVIGQKLYEQEDSEQVKICIDNGQGDAEKMTPQQFKEFMQRNDEQPLNVEIVFLHIWNGEELGQIFRELGVKNVFIFEPSEIHISAVNTVQEKSFQKNFSLQMILHLMKDQTIKGAFDEVIASMKKNEYKTEVDRIKWLGQSDDDQEKLFLNPLEDGEVEIIDWSQLKDPSNLDKMTSGFIIGRQKEMLSVINKLQERETKMFRIVGDQGIGKTRFVKELAKYIMQRHLVNNGVYYLDFKNVQNQSQIENLFQLNGLDYLLKHQESKDEKLKNIKEKESNLRKRILLIYDNVDEIEKDKIIFKWHLLLLMKNKFKIQVITTKSCMLVNQEQSFGEVFLLGPLSTQYSAQLVRLYCLRDLQMNELIDNDNSENQVSQSCDQYQLMEELGRHQNILKCNGNPQALIILALILRTKKMNEIEIYIKLIDRSSLLSHQKKKRTSDHKCNPDNIIYKHKRNILNKIQKYLRSIMKVNGDPSQISVSQTNDINESQYSDWNQSDYVSKFSFQQRNQGMRKSITGKDAQQNPLSLLNNIKLKSQGALKKKKTQIENTNTIHNDCMNFSERCIIQVQGTFNTLKNNKKSSQLKFDIFENINYDLVWDLVNIEFENYIDQIIVNVQENIIKMDYSKIREQVYKMIISESEKFLTFEVNSFGTLKNKYSQITIAQHVETLNKQYDCSLQPDLVTIVIPTIQSQIQRMQTGQLMSQVSRLNSLRTNSNIFLHADPEDNQSSDSQQTYLKNYNQPSQQIRNGFRKIETQISRQDNIRKKSSKKNKKFQEKALRSRTFKSIQNQGSLKVIAEENKSSDDSENDSDVYIQTQEIIENSSQTSNLHTEIDDEELDLLEYQYNSNIENQEKYSMKKNNSHQQPSMNQFFSDRDIQWNRQQTSKRRS